MPAATWQAVAKAASRRCAALRSSQTRRQYSAAADCVDFDAGVLPAPRLFSPYCGLFFLFFFLFPARLLLFCLFLPIWCHVAALQEETGYGRNVEGLIPSRSKTYRPLPPLPLAIFLSLLFHPTAPTAPTAPTVRYGKPYRPTALPYSTENLPFLRYGTGTVRKRYGYGTGTVRYSTGLNFLFHISQSILYRFRPSWCVF